jgi:hypothetical protein
LASIIALPQVENLGGINYHVLSSYCIHSPNSTLLCSLSHINPTASSCGLNTSFANEKNEAQREHLSRYHSQAEAATSYLVPLISVRGTMVASRPTTVSPSSGSYAQRVEGSYLKENLELELRPKIF